MLVRSWMAVHHWREMECGSMIRPLTTLYRLISGSVQVGPLSQPSTEYLLWLDLVSTLPSQYTQIDEKYPENVDFKEHYVMYILNKILQSRSYI